MLQLVFTIIILYIIFEQFSNEYASPLSDTIKNEGSDTFTNTMTKEKEEVVEITEKEPEVKKQKVKKDKKKKAAKRVHEFDKPNPWTKIIYDEELEYPYLFHIKLRIPSLNDFQSWKQIIPNLDFDPVTGELIIPSKDEASVLAIANLIASNFAGHLSLEAIIEKKLIQISITKAKTYDMVKNKLREQIVDQLYGSKFDKKSDFEEDLATNNNINMKEHESSTFEPFDGNDYSYI